MRLGRARSMRGDGAMGGAKKRAKKKTKKPAQAEIAAKATSPAKSKGKSKDKSKATPEPLYLTEEDVKSLVTVKDAIATLEELFATWSDPATVNLPRQRARAGDSAFNLMGAAWGAKALFGLKAYYIGSGGARSHVLLYSSRDAKLRAMIESAISAGCAPARRGGLQQNPLPSRRRGRSALSARASKPLPKWRRSAPCAGSSPCLCSVPRPSIATLSPRKSSSSSVSPRKRCRPPRPPSHQPTLSSPSPNRLSRCCARTG